MSRKADTPLITLEDVADHLLKESGFDASQRKVVWDYQPVNVQTFIMSPSFLDLGDYVRPNVMYDMIQIFGDDPFRVAPVYNYAIFSEAVGTGKTFREAIMALYMTYKLLCLHDPVDYFNSLGIPGQPRLAKGSKLACILMAVTEKNARKVIYSEVGAKVANSPWFKEHYPPNSSVKTELQFDPRPEGFRGLEDRIYKNVYIIPGSSSEYAAVGYNVIMGAIDEATLFEDTQDASLAGGSDLNDQAEVVFATLDSRIESRFKRQGLLVIAGNPKHERDFLERHAEDAQGDPDAYIVTRRPIWASTMPDFDPDTDPSFYFHLHRLEIVSDKFKNQPGIIPIPMDYYRRFKKEPEVAKRDLAGYPSSAVGRVIVDPTLIERRANRERKDPILEITKDSPVPVLIPYPPKAFLPDWFERKHLVWHGVHMDLAEKGDAAALCVAHVSHIGDDGEPFVFTDLFLRWQGTPENELKHDYVLDWILYLHDVLGFDFGSITADKHQSSYLLQRLTDLGYRTGILSTETTTNPYDELIQTIRASRHDYYFHPIAVRELTDLERRKGKYDHPRRGSKDLSDAWAGAIYNAIRCANYAPPVDRLKNDGKGGGGRALVFGGRKHGLGTGRR